MCQISSLVAATDGAVAEFSSFANFEERKRKSNLLMSFPKIVHQKGSFGQIRKNLLFRFCRPILDIFGLTLLNIDGPALPVAVTTVLGRQDRMFKEVSLHCKQPNPQKASQYLMLKGSCWQPRHQ